MSQLTINTSAVECHVVTGSAVHATLTVQSVSALLSTASTTLDHGELTGLADDDHLLYHTDARGDARYSGLGHSHLITDVTGLQTALCEPACNFDVVDGP